MDLNFLAVSTFNGLVYGAFLLVTSIGLSLVFGLGRVANFAHGAFYALGGYALLELTRRTGLGFWGALAAAPLLVLPVAALVERLAVAPLHARPDTHTLLATFGVSFMMLGATEFAWGTGTMIIEAPPALARTVVLFGNPYPAYRPVAALLCLAVAAAVFAFVQFTPAGLRIRAITEDAGMAEAVGIDTRRELRVVFALAAGLAALAGAIGAPVFSVHPEMGMAFLLDAFLAVIIGGLGYLPGCVAGAFIVALVKSIGGAYAAEWSVGILFIVVALVLVVRPTGVFGRGRVA